MARKILAAFLLVAMAAWAELALAPMFAMHYGHMQRGSEMDADMPAHHAGHYRHAHHAQAVVPAHLCCPGLHKAPPDATMELVSGAPGCDDPHSCCFRQGPQSVPAPASDAQDLTREMATADVALLKPAPPLTPHHGRESLFALPPPLDVFGMTLRV